jgi:hypothetical protein
MYTTWDGTRAETPVNNCGIKVQHVRDVGRRIGRGAWRVCKRDEKRFAKIAKNGKQACGLPKSWCETWILTSRWMQMQIIVVWNRIPRRKTMDPALAEMILHFTRTSVSKMLIRLAALNGQQPVDFVPRRPQSRSKSSRLSLSSRGPIRGKLDPRSSEQRTMTPRLDDISARRRSHTLYKRQGERKKHSSSKRRTLDCADS